jgi:hypothetical protein
MCAADATSGGIQPREVMQRRLKEIRGSLDLSERGKAPDQIVASRRTDGKVDRTRPLCPYPQVAKYKGSGSTDDAANFVCAAP